MAEPRDPERKKPVTRMNKRELVSTMAKKSGLAKASAEKETVKK
jgi:hypothetical protein